MAKVALIIASTGFQPLEYGETKRVLQAANITVVTVSDQLGVARTADGKQQIKVDLALNQVNPADYAGIFLIGGSGALHYLDQAETYRILAAAARDIKMLWGAICISPRILARAGLLDGRKVTGWDDDQQLAGILQNAGAEYIKTGVVIDRDLITANGPATAREFGQAIVRTLGTISATTNGF